MKSGLINTAVEQRKNLSPGQESNFFLAWHFICFLLDINECLNSSCGNNADCLDLPGGFKCHCKDDFTGKNCNTSKFEKLKTINLPAR